MRLIEVIEASLGMKARLDLKPMQPGDVPATCADISELDAAVGFRPDTPIETGIARFIDWYRDFYRVARGQPAHCLQGG
jgi:UDP-glucuronate 4-epimerase